MGRNDIIIITERMRSLSFKKAYVRRSHNTDFTSIENRFEDHNKKQLSTRANVAVYCSGTVLANSADIPEYYLQTVQCTRFIIHVHSS